MHLRSLSAALTAGLLAVGLLVPSISPATADETESETAFTVSDGSLDWGFKESFRTYVPSSGQSAGAGATKNEDGTFSWPVASGDYDPEARELSATAAGQVIFNFQGHGFEIAIADPVVTVQGGAGLLNAEIVVKSLDAATGEVRSTQRERVDVAELDLARGTRVVDDGTMDWTAIPATMTAEGAEAFAADMAGDGNLTYFYSRGTILDPVDLHLSGDWPAQDEEETWTAAGTGVPVDVERLVPHIGLAANDYVAQLVHDSPRGIVYALVHSYSGTNSYIWAVDAENGGLMSEEPVFTSANALNNILVADDGTLLAVARTPASALGLEPANFATSVLVTIPRTEDDWGTPVYHPLNRTLDTVSGFDPDSGDVYGIANGNRWTAEGESVSAPAYAFTRYADVLATPGVTDVAQLADEPRAEGTALHAGDFDLRRAIIDWDRGHALLWYPNYGSTPAQLVDVPLGSDTPTITRHDLPAAGEFGLDAVNLSSEGILFASLADGTVRAIDTTDDWTEVASLPHNLSSPSLVVDEEHATVWLQGVGTTADGNPVSAYDISAADPAKWRAAGATHLVAPGYAYSTHPMAVGDGGDLFIGIYRYSSKAGAPEEHGIRRVRLFTSPAVTAQPVDAVVAQGSDDVAEFTVESTGSPTPSIVWQEKSAFGWGDLTDGDGVSGATTGTLRLEGDAVVDGRQVRAVLSNSVEDFRGATVEVGAIVSEVATVAVHRAPVITTQPNAVTTVEGTDATFAVFADGNPEPKVSWQRRAGGFWQAIADDDENFVIDQGTLTVPDVITEQSGATFRARVRNAAGTTYSRSATLTVNPAVSIPEDGLDLTGVTLDWSGSVELQSAPPVGGSNYFSAGVSDGLEATYRATDGAVRILQIAADGAESPATYATRAAHVNTEGAQLVRLSDGEASIEPDGSATVEWNGSWSVNFYGGMVPFTLTDPELTVDDDGKGTLKADLSGYASSMDNPEVKTLLDPVEDVTIATFSNARVDPAGKVVISPDYAGVTLDVPAGQTPQNRTAAGWGSWPQEFVDFHFETGLSSYWYSSGGAADAKKAPDAFAVDFTDAVSGGDTAPVITAQPQSISAAPATDVTLAVTATGAELRYRWQKRIGSLWIDIPDETSAALRLSGVVPDDSGAYRVRVSNDAGSAVSSTATVTVAKNASAVTIKAPTATRFGRAVKVVVRVPGRTGEVTLTGAGRPKTAVLSGGRATFALPRALKSDVYQLQAAYPGDGTHAGAAASKRLKVKRAAVSFKELRVTRTPRHDRAGRARIALRSQTGTPVSGRAIVVLKQGKTTKRVVARVKSGKTSVRLPKLRRGTWELKAAYRKSANFKRSAELTRLRVTR